MENAEEVMQLLEEFSKTKPKEIPKELEDYLGYVAKSGDPLFQWSLVKNLFREKLVNVITDFYESTLTVELPPCPNVESFNYDRMKTSLLERFDTFTSAPFTVQRICELLTNPRKEYNRADKFMRAIEKNILVVSTREPGTGKRPLECDETVLNGMPDVKLSESDGSLVHVPTDLPYLGAPPASNDVTVETTERSVRRHSRHRRKPSNKIDKVFLEVNGQVSKGQICWLLDEASLIGSQSSDDSDDDDFSYSSATKAKTTEEKSPQESDSNTNNSLINVDNSHPSTSSNETNFEGESSISLATETNELSTALPDAGGIDVSDSSKDCNELQTDSNVFEKLENTTDEKEAPSSLPDATISSPKPLEETANSEVEATDNDLQCSELEPKSDNNEVDRESETKTLLTVVTEVTASEEISECTENESPGTVDLPASPTGNVLPRPDDTEISLVDHSNLSVVVEECKHPHLQLDSINDVPVTLCSQEALDQPLQSEKCSEGSVLGLNKNIVGLDQEKILDATSEENVTISHENITMSESPEQIPRSSPDLNTGINLDNIIEQECFEKSSENVLLSIPEGSLVSDENCTELPVVEDFKLKDSIQVCDNEFVEEMNQERREESVIQSLPVAVVSDSVREIVAIEEISVDPSCEAEEAMDVDDSSNQMMVSEGENEGEPMDQSEQPQS